MKIKPTTEQKQIINHHDGIAIGSAGPGCGKTQTLILTIQHAIKKDIKPEEIVVLTYNRSTVSDFRARLQKVLGRKAKNIRVMTFHSFGASLIREHWSTLGFNSKPKTKSENYIPYKLLNRVATKYEVDDGTLEKAFKGYHCKKDQEFKDALAELYAEYQEFKLINNFIDFGDMQALLLELFKSPDILQKVTSNYRYLLVDELQDINENQAQLIQYLAPHIETTTLVGDKKQMIYGFRNADPEHWNNLVEKLNPTIYQLTRSFRCPQEALGLINEVGSNICGDKPLTSEQEGIKPELYNFADIDDQYDFLTEKILMLINDKGVNPNEIVVLTRVHNSYLNLKKVLDDHNIPCVEGKAIKGGNYHSTIRGGFKLQRDLLRIIKWVANKRLHKVPEDAIRHVLKVLRIDSELINKIIKEGWKAMSVPSVHKNYRLVLNIRNAVNKASECTDTAHAVERLIDSISPIISSRFKPYKKMILRDLSGIKCLVRNTPLADIKIKDIQAPSAFEEDESVLLTTAHSAKGKEWKYVFLIHVVEGEFPIHYSKSDTDKLEEMRVFYVAITRHSRKLCILQYPKTITHYPNRGRDTKYSRETLSSESSLITGLKKYLKVAN